MCPAIAAIINPISLALDEFEAIYKQTDVALDSFYDASGAPTFTKSRLFFNEDWHRNGRAAGTYTILFRESGVAIESSFAVHVDLRDKDDDFIYTVNVENAQYEFESGEEYEVVNTINMLAIEHFEHV